jgi:hypothetical protein
VAIRKGREVRLAAPDAEAAVMANQPRDRPQRTKARSKAQFIPVPRADWFAPDDWRETMERALERHKRAERDLGATQWGATILRTLPIAYSKFWDWAIDDATGKGLTGNAKRLMRLKGHYVVEFRGSGTDPQPYLDTLKPLQDILASLRIPGRPSKTPFHDLVALAYLIARKECFVERMPRLDLLRRFLEFPELGYALGPRDITRIAYAVIDKIVKGKMHCEYPGTAAFCSALDPSLKCLEAANLPQLKPVRNGGFRN